MYFPLAVFIGHADLNAVNEFVCDRAVECVEMGVLLDQRLLPFGILPMFTTIRDLTADLVHASSGRLFFRGKTVAEQPLFLGRNHAVEFILIHRNQSLFRSTLPLIVLVFGQFIAPVL